MLDKKKVKVLVRSDELQRRYKHDPVIISFEWGKGVVYHMISHFYLQRSETRTKKQGELWLPCIYRVATTVCTHTQPCPETVLIDPLTGTMYIL